MQANKQQLNQQLSKQHQETQSVQRTACGFISKARQLGQPTLCGYVVHATSHARQLTGPTAHGQGRGKAAETHQPLPQAYSPQTASTAGLCRQLMHAAAAHVQSLVGVPTHCD
jgi:hypothetical protein